MEGETKEVVEAKGIEIRLREWVKRWGSHGDGGRGCGGQRRGKRRDKMGGR